MNTTSKPLDAINHKRTVWAAIGAGLLTVIAIPQVQQSLVYLITHPNPQGIGAAAGTALTGLLLYYSKPLGVS